MKNEYPRHSLQMLKDYINSIDINVDDYSVKKAQLRAIEKTIKQLEKKFVPVPAVLISERETLITELAARGASDTPWSLYDELLDIINQIGHALGKKPHKDLYLRAKELRKKTMPKSVWWPCIKEMLKSRGGSASEQDILNIIAEKFEDRFTPADLEKPYGKSARWESNVRSERNRMIRDNILTKESKRKTWELVNKNS